MGVKTRMIDFLMEAARGSSARIAELQEQVLDPQAVARAEALKLDSADFEGADPNVRVGLAYLKGRMQNLEEDLARAQAYAVQLKETHTKEMSKLANEKWRVDNELRVVVRERDALKEKLFIDSEELTEEDEIDE